MPEITRAGVQLFYSESGDGTAVLFHTGGAGDGQMWRMAGYTDIIGGCLQILLDHRGRGRSGRPADMEAHRQEEYVADVFAVLDHVGADRAVLIGYSFGASVVYAAAAAHPERCCAVVGIGGLGPPDEVSTVRPPIIDQLRDRGTRAVIEEMAARESEPCPAWLLDNLSTTDAEMFALQLEGCLDAASAWEHFPLITTPVLIVCGELEDDGEAALAASTLANVTAVVLPGYGHLQAFWHGEVTAPLIRDFLIASCSLVTREHR
jgi:pimeloyl-ACP methyl ester carboxylesterase